MNEPQRALPEEVAQSSSFLLTQLDLYDWGAFGGRHSARIDPVGTAIVGPTGSGKTTLVDGLMTLLCANPRYNLASTGGHESDRDLVSYVRGVAGAGTASGGSEHIARPGAVVTGLAARFARGDETVTIGALLWFDSSSSAVADLKRRWVFCQGPASGLDDWLSALRDGGVRKLREQESEIAGLKFYEARKTYLARLRSHFEVGENAFDLLNRAAGLKQLNSIDEVFRDLVLDDRSAFDRATEVANEFNTLAAIHAELETARRQRDALVPVQQLWQECERHAGQRDRQEQLLALIPRWFAAHAQRLWTQRIDHTRRELQQLDQTLIALDQRLAAQQQHCDSLQARYFELGGAVVEQLRQRIEEQQPRVEATRGHAAQYRQLMAVLGLPETLDAPTLAHNRSSAERRLAALEGEIEAAQQQLFDAAAGRKLAEDAQLAVCAELDAARASPHSNIPSGQQRFREVLAAALGTEDAQLPFVAELVQVRAEEGEWRGAIERALGSERLRILVPPTQMQAALAWVNDRDNQLHVRLREAAVPESLSRFLADGFVRKLEFRAHPLREALKALLAEVDRHCVDSVQILRETAHAMTRQGLMSGRKGQFDKQDQKALDADWMTGFDNRDRLAQLQAALARASEQFSGAREHFDAARRVLDALMQTRQQLEQLRVLEFDRIDLPGAERALAALHTHLSALTAAGSDAGQAHRDWQAAAAALTIARKEQLALKVREASAGQALAGAQRAQDAARSAVGEALSAAQQALAAECLSVPGMAELDEIGLLERQALKAQQERLTQLAARLASSEKALLRAMNAALAVDTGALVEVGTETRDVPAYLERLRVLNEEALPDKIQRFLEYLNQSSDQGVTQLLTDVDNEVSTIEERIEDLNFTLRAVDFQPGRYLRLEPQKIVHEGLRNLRQAQAQLRAAALKDDLGESHYKALQYVVSLLREAVDKRRTLAARALLDPRFRLQFAVSVVERVSGQVIETRTNSQGGSGGEKEIIASYVLTASLAYALSPQANGRPLFGSIVLDEAFSKSSQAVAGRIIRALAEFGLHPLFVTPNKELRLLRTYTRSAILIHRRGAQATMTSLSWQELEQHARRRIGSQDEVAD